MLAWGIAAGLCLALLRGYSSTPGEAGEQPQLWPAESQIAPGTKFTLLFFAHPLCPCTRSSLAELQRLALVCNGRVDTHVLFIAPQGKDKTWSQSDLYATAQSIPGVAVHRDVDRRESQLFDVRTSGACLLYDHRGKLLFRGGLTAARGHEGDCEGTDSIRALVLGRGERTSESSVYGCPLFESQTTCPTVAASVN